MKTGEFGGEMWDHITPKNLLDFQKEAKTLKMYEEARELYRQGYPVEADRILDELKGSQVPRWARFGYRASGGDSS